MPNPDEQHIELDERQGHGLSFEEDCDLVMAALDQFPVAAVLLDVHGDDPGTVRGVAGRPRAPTG